MELMKIRNPAFECYHIESKVFKPGPFIEPLKGEVQDF